MTNELMAFAIASPLIGALSAVVIPRYNKSIGLLSVILTTACVIALLFAVMSEGGAWQALGGWQTGLGIALHIDALSVLMLLMTAAVGLAISIYALRYFSTLEKSSRFWPLWLMLIAALNALYLSADLFNLYITLELLGISAVALTALGGSRESTRAALRYLLFGLIGSMGYLFGVAILYIAYGTLDIAQLSQRITPDAASLTALTLMSAGLLLKSALFPLHFWLPAAHSNAPAPVSAALSALVVKAGFYLMLRLWTEVFPNAFSPNASILIGLLGCAAIIWGSWQALQTPRLKLLAAYSTVAQLGYLFVGLMLIVTTPAGVQREIIYGAVILMALSHAFAKSALFLSIGVVQQHAGHDRIEELDGTSQKLPATTFTLALAGVALIGLPPSGAFIGKWHLLSSVISQHQWWLVAVMAIGTLLATAYVFRVLGHAFGNAATADRPVNMGTQEWPALILGMTATFALGLGSAWIWNLLETAA